MENLKIDLPSVRMPGDRQIVPLTGRHRKHVRIMRQEHVQRTRRNHLFRAQKIRLLEFLVIDAREIDRRLPESKDVRPAAQKIDPDARPFPRNIILAHAVNLVIAHAPEHTRIRP